MGDAVDEVAGAVDRVDDPEVLAGEGLGGLVAAAVQLLAEHRVVGERPTDHLDDRALAVEVGLGDHVVGPLVVLVVLDPRRHPASKMPGRDGPADLRGGFGHFHLGLPHGNQPRSPRDAATGRHTASARPPNARHYTAPAPRLPNAAPFLRGESLDFDTMRGIQKKVDATFCGASGLWGD